MRGQLFAASGRVVWQTAYPAALGPPASNGALVAVPLGAGRAAVRASASGGLVRVIALAAPQALRFASRGGIVADTLLCGRGPGYDCRATTAVSTWSGRCLRAFGVGGHAAPTVESGVRG